MKKIAFIGAGEHASKNLYPSAMLCDAEIVGVSTRSISTAENAISKFGLTSARAYDDYKNMLTNPDLDGVIISTGIDNQYNVVLDVIKAGKAFLVEKPLGMTAKEATAVAELAELNGVLGMVAFMKRFAPAHQMLKNALEDELIGNPLSFNAMMSVDCTDFVESDEMMLKCAMIHYLDLARHLLGEAVDIRGFRNTVGKNTNLCATVKFESGVCGNFYFSGSKAWSRHEEFFTITGDMGIAKVYDFTKFSLHRHEAVSGVPWQTLSECDTVYHPATSTSSGGFRDLYMNGFVGEIEHFLHCLKTGEPPITNLWDNAKTMKFCEDFLSACYK